MFCYGGLSTQAIEHFALTFLYRILLEKHVLSHLFLFGLILGPILPILPPFYEPPSFPEF